jgi:hypothetical protein
MILRNNLHLYLHPSPPLASYPAPKAECCPPCEPWHLVGFVLILFSLLYEGVLMPADDPLRFKVVRTNGHDEVVARATNLIIGRAAYETARRLYPNDRVDYRDGARIIARWRLTPQRCGSRCGYAFPQVEPS